MEIIPTALDGVFTIEVNRHGDSRGYFCETYRRNELEEALGYAVEWVQDNESLSSAGVVRGMHWQAAPYSQAKLVRVVRGSILDVVLDLRPQSPTFGRHVAVPLDAAGGRQLFMPRGCAHGFAVLEEALFLYKVDNYWNAAAERSVNLFDPALGIEWPFDRDHAIISDKDMRAPLLQDLGISPAIPAPKRAKS